MKLRICLLVALVLTIGMHQVCAQVSFAPATNYVVGNFPTSVTAADINGDGKANLISVNQNDNTLTILTNNGNGGFGSNATLAVGFWPTCVVAADINGYGKPDLISAKNSSLRVPKNNSSGSFVFGFGRSIPGSGSQWVVAADINGDGKV